MEGLRRREGSKRMLKKVILAISTAATVALTICRCGSSVKMERRGGRRRRRTES